MIDKINRIAKRISLVILEFALQFLPIFLLFIVHLLTNSSVSETSNVNYYSGLLQIIIVDTSVNLCFVLKKHSNYISSIMYVLLLSASIALFVLVQVVPLEVFQSNSGDLIFQVIKIMVLILIITKVISGIGEDNE